MYFFNRFNPARIKINRISFRGYSTKEVRVRFAPSPTGYLHLGGLRTAIYNYFFARKHAGKFILRIEDTDQTRLIEGAAQALQDDLTWSGIEIDEGPGIGGIHGPYTQSERLELYKDQVKVLLENGSAYPCFCTDRRLDLIRREAARIRQIPKYDNRCRYLKKDDVAKRLKRGDKHCVRFKLTPDCETFEDMIYGNICYDVALHEGDPIIVKTDGFPTYHFANVVDDHFMRITHVFRGVEWQISTTKHILMYRAFNWEPPIFGHLPLLMNPDGTKLSKRQGDVKIGFYKENGIFPMALVNFITHSGGGFEKDRDPHHKPTIFTLEQLTKQFDVERINSHSGRIMPDRLLEFNRLELKRRLQDEQLKADLLQQVKDLIKKNYAYRNEDCLQTDDEYITAILTWSVNRINKISDLFTEDLAFLWVIPDLSSMKYTPNDVVVLQKIIDTFSEVEINKQALNEYFRNMSTESGTKFKEFMRLLRMILSGLKEGPSVAEMVEILGKDNTKTRLQLFINKTNTLR